MERVKEEHIIYGNQVSSSEISTIQNLLSSEYRIEIHKPRISIQEYP